MFNQDLFSIFNAPKKDERNKPKQFEVQESAANQSEPAATKKMHTEQPDNL